MIPREYQTAAVDSLFDYFTRNKGNPIIALPTGTGKSLIIALFIKTALERYPQTRIMKLTHVKELIEQNFNKLIHFWPLAPAGIYSAGLKRKESSLPITFGGIGTVAKADIKLFGKIDLLIIDECHLVSNTQSTMYRKLIAKLSEINPNLKIVGLTATHYRLGTGSLIGEGGLFTDVCFDMTQREKFNWFLDEGYLSRLVPRPTKLTIDISDVHIKGGEFKADELQKAVDKETITMAAITESIATGRERKHWLVFAAGVEHAIHVTEMLNSLGVPAVVVHSKMPTLQRDEAIEGFKTGVYKAIVNNGILTTGFDFPGIDFIVMLRHTQSASLWVQMLGRGTRPVYADGFDLSIKEERLEAINAGPKKDCLVLDFARNTIRLGPINDPIIPQKKKKGRLAGIAPVKLCGNCGAYVHSSVRFCPHCGFEFPESVKIDQHASSAELIAGNEEQPVSHYIATVDKVTMEAYRKTDKPPSLMVTYYCGLNRYREWVCIEHGGFAAKKARNWWRQRALAASAIPATTIEAISKLGALKTPSRLLIKRNPRGYDNVVDYTFGTSVPMSWSSLVSMENKDEI